MSLRASLSERYRAKIREQARRMSVAQCDEMADLLLEPPVSDFELALGHAWRQEANLKRQQRKDG